MDATVFRTREAVLWVAAAVSLVASLLLYLIMPGALEELLAGEMEGEALTDGMGFFMAGMLIVPLLMVVATLLVGDRLNRFLNLVGGLLVGLFGTYAVGNHLANGGFNGHVLLAIVASLLAFLVAGLAAVTLRKPAADTTAAAAEPKRHHFGTAA